MKVIRFIRRLWSCKWIFRSLLSTVYFNFHYFPWRQAVHLPVLLYKPRLLRCRGKVKLDVDVVRMGMVILGKDTVSLYPNSGLVWECDGEVVFTGICYIGNSSALSVSKTGHVVFGGGFHASAALKLVSYYDIRFGDDVHIGWDCIVTDTDFHKLVSFWDAKSTKGYARVFIGKGNWLGMKCCVLKGTCTPAFCTVSAGSVLTGDYGYLPSYSVVGTNARVVLRKEGFYRDFDDDKIIYK